jgi:hypothetical protein
MITKTKTNGYELSDEMLRVLYGFEEAVDRVFGTDKEETDVTIEHFYYGNKLDMITVKVPGRGYGDYNLTAHGVHFNGHTCTEDDYRRFASLAWNDDLFEEDYGNFWQYLKK